MTPLQKQELLTFNGIDGDTGRYLIPPMTPEEFVDATFGKTKPTADQIDAAKSRTLSDDEIADLGWRNTLDSGHYGVQQGVEADRLDQAGWGVIFAYGANPAIVEALQPLLTLRQGQAAKTNERLYRQYSGADGYRWSPASNGKPAYRESKAEFLKRQGAESSGPVNPEKMPYYLLIVGDPDTIPYSFQYQMDVQYAVGRIHFDTPEEYARYAESVVAAETGKIALPRRAAFFGPWNPGDGATELSSGKLIPPLFDKAKALVTSAGGEWSVNCLTPAESTRARLNGLMGGEDTPAFLFTASHGMSYPDTERQLEYSGGLICQDWPGSEHRGPMRDFLFAGEDLTDDKCVAGMIAMFFACFGAGTPQYNDFASMDGKRNQLAEKAFVGNLPRRLLSHPKGGALAVMGHVDRVWSTSFLDYGKRTATTCFESALGILLGGKPIGMASEYFNSRYAEIGSMLSEAYEDAKWNPSKRPQDALEFTTLWTSNSDSRNYVIVGDPAVRLCFAEDTPQGGSPRTRAAAILKEIVPPAPAAPAEPAPEPPAVALEQKAFSAVLDGEGSGEALRKALSSLSASLVQTLGNLTRLDVTTYTSGQLSAVSFKDGVISGAQLRAITSVSASGNMQVVVPETDGKVDDAVWQIHKEALSLATAHRLELVKAILSGGLIKGDVK